MTLHFPFLNLLSYFIFFIFSFNSFFSSFVLFTFYICIVFYIVFLTFINCQIVLQVLSLTTIHWFGSISDHTSPLRGFLVSKSSKETNLDQCTFYLLLWNMALTLAPHHVTIPQGKCGLHSLARINCFLAWKQLFGACTKCLWKVNLPKLYWSWF
jgi:hypothetical protein